ncbi:unnamed protein product [Closterium sp. NIES-54]
MPPFSTRSSLLFIFGSIAQVLFAILSLSTAEAAAATAAAAHPFGPIEGHGVASAAASGLSVSASALGLDQRRRGSGSSASLQQESSAKRTLKSAEGGVRGTCAQCREQLKELQEWFAGVEASKLGDAGSEGQPGGGGGRGRGGGGRGGAGGRGTEAENVMELQSRLVEKQGELKRLKAEYEALQKRHEKVNGDKAALDVKLTESGADWGKKAITKEALSRATELLHSCKPQTGPVISKKVSSWKGYSCSATERELQRYMDFETRGMCPDDWLFVQDLIFRKQCHSLPKRRCLARTAHKIVECGGTTTPAPPSPASPQCPRPIRPRPLPSLPCPYCSLCQDPPLSSLNPPSKTSQCGGTTTPSPPSPPSTPSPPPCSYLCQFLSFFPPCFCPEQPLSRPTSLFSQSALQDASVRWNSHAFSSFASLNALSPSALATATAGTGDACGRQPGGGGCWNMSAEERRWLAKPPKNTAGGGALTVKEVIAIKKGALRIGLDFNGGSGSFAAHMARHNVTMMTSAMNLEANVGRKKGLPFLETIALRGLVPIWLPYKVRLPFYDNTLDILHATNAIKFMPSPAEFEEVLFEWDRVLRVGGVMWLEEFTASAAEMPSYLSVVDLLKYRQLHWSLTPPKAMIGKPAGTVILHCLLEKPMRKDL